MNHDSINGDAWLKEAENLQNAENYSDAVQAYEKALEFGSIECLFKIAYRIAQCYALTLNMDNAWEWLVKAVELGYDKLMNIQVDEAFHTFHEHDSFRELVGLAQKAPLSRAEGLRRNIDLVVREVKRIRYAPFQNVSEAEFLRQAESIKTQADSLNDLQFTAEVMALLQDCGDGHTTLFWGGEADYFNQVLPVEFYLFEEGLIITSAIPEFAQLVSRRIDLIDGCNIEELILRLAPYISRDNDIWLRHAVPVYLRNVPLLHAAGIAHSPERVVLTIGGNHVEVPTHTGRTNLYMYDPQSDWVRLIDQIEGEVPIYLKYRDQFHYVTYVEDQKLLYAGFNQVFDMPDQSVLDFSNQIAEMLRQGDVSKFVLDLRWNTGGNTYLVMPLLHQIIAAESQGLFDELYVIIGRRTYSAAMNLATLLDRHTNAIFVGEPTGSSPNFIGESNEFVLPYEPQIAISISDLFWQSSWPSDSRQYIAPHIDAPPTFATFQQGVDPALEAILSA